MLEKMKNELRMVVVYDAWFIILAAVVNNGGIDKYLFDEIIDTCEAIPQVLMITVGYLVIMYLYKIISKQVKSDLYQIKTELNKEKKEA